MTDDPFYAKKELHFWQLLFDGEEKNLPGFGIGVDLFHPFIVKVCVNDLFPSA